MARILLAKLGTDAHENGVIVVAKWLRDAGHEVTYSGLYKTPAQLAEIAKAERPDVIGVSFLASEPVFLSARLLQELGEAGLEDIPLVVGGVVTPAMAEALRAMGIDAIFTPGARREAILDGIAGAVAGGGRNLP